MKFNFIQLDPRTKKEEQPKYDLGIEVTIPGMKNDIDHHGDKADLPSAAMQTLENVNKIIASLFENGQQTQKNKEETANIILATVRPDSDSVTAMAILKASHEGKNIDRELVRFIDVLDRFGPNKLKSEKNENSEKYHKITTAIGFVTGDFKKTMEEKVSFVETCLDGSVDADIIEKYWAQKATDLERARTNSKILELVPNKLVYVESKDRNATVLGYEIADTVIACNPEMPILAKDPESNQLKPTGETYVKYTICKATELVETDIDSIVKELNSMEAGRGGRGTIIGSPQNVSSNLTPEQVGEIVKKYTV